MSYVIANDGTVHKLTVLKGRKTHAANKLLGEGNWLLISDVQPSSNVATDGLACA